MFKTFRHTHLNRILVCVMMLFMMASFAVYGAVDNSAYEVTNYDFKATVDKTHSYMVTEKITVNLPENLDSISFVMPNGNYRVFGLKVEKTDYKSSRKSDANTVTIIDADKLTKGKHTYTIEYTIREFEDRDSEKDMFYFDALLPSWSRPITKLSIQMDFPEDFPWQDMQYYAGQYGVQDVNTKLSYVEDKENKSIKITGERIPENFGISIKAALPDGYWDGALDGAWATHTVFIVMLAVVLLMFIMWFVGGRDPKVSKVEQYHPIDGISPAEIGYILNTRVRTRDIIALIAYFGTKGYLKISEYEPKRYRLIKKEYPKQEEKFVRNAYDILFEDVPDNRWVEMDSLGEKLLKIKTVIQEDVAAGFSSKEMNSYTSLSRTFRIVGTVLMGLSLGAVCILKYSYQYMTANYFEAGIVAAITMFVMYMLCQQFDRHTYLGERYRIFLIGFSILYVAIPVYVGTSLFLMTGHWIPAVAVLVGSLVGGLFIILMRARAKGNAVLAGRFSQLRHFIYHPTASVLAECFVKDPNYYYEILPYALYFNGLETWAISFLTLPVPEPEWYSDDIEGHAFSNIRGQATVLDYARDIKAFARTIESAYRAMMRRHKR